MNRVLSIGAEFPHFEKIAVVSLEKGRAFATISSADHRKHNRWMVMFWYPKDFTFVCPTEIAEFSSKNQDFADRDAIVIAASTDTEHVHLAWRNNHDDLRDLKFPMLADTNKELADALGILTPDERVANRATFVVDPNGIIRWVSVYDMNVGRNVDEVLRVLDALQTDELCPCNWKSGEETLGK